ncbi:UvrB/UvrC motif-containing protein [Candidatus Parcubacteria bacterium]|nr:UvrB/UvrC motif-containing protein [Candidatus Parcubacteria bacterium]
MNSQDLLKLDLPDCPGVYYFLGPKKEVLYVGKATSLKDRVKSYFAPDLMATRGEKLVRMLEQAVSLDYTTTDSVLEAIILEAHEIQKHDPIANTISKDNKSFNYVAVTDEDFPRIVVRRGRTLSSIPLVISGATVDIDKVFGPFPHGGELREALKIVRRIFPYRDEKCKLQPSNKPLKPCFNAQIGFCPGPCAGWIGKTEYRKQVRRIKLFFSGKKTELIKDIEKDMKKAAKEQRFEDANKLKRTLHALEHIQDMALIKRDIERTHDSATVRIEAYDIAHLSGQQAVGVMTVVEDGERCPSQYRKFKIKVDKNDDVGNLKEVIRRRLGHPEWDMPQIIVVDGGVGQINGANEVLKQADLNIDVVSVVKDASHKAKGILGGERHGEWAKSILLANTEAHRFAIGYHRKLRGKGFRI